MIKVYNREELNAQLQKSHKSLALFYSSWCPYCLRFVPFFNTKVEEAGFESIIHVLLEDNDNILWDDYGIAAVPTVILFENGQVCDRLDGRLGVGLNEKQFSEWLQKLKQA
jgi:thioredoxin-like negative regulator of GroEL